jgi:hypothetical protein
MKRDCKSAAYLAVLTVLLLGVIAPLQAHHSMAMFDLDKTITLEGTVTEVAWGNPHTIFLCDANEPGVENSPVRNWTLEAPSPSVLVSKGMKPDTIKVGDKIGLTGNPRKDGKAVLLVQTVTDATGKKYAIKDTTGNY